jgi:hypothetical protein
MSSLEDPLANAFLGEQPFVNGTELLVELDSENKILITDNGVTETKKSEVEVAPSKPKPKSGKSTRRNPRLKEMTIEDRKTAVKILKEREILAT